MRWAVALPCVGATLEVGFAPPWGGATLEVVFGACLGGGRPTSEVGFFVYLRGCFLLK